MPRTETTFINRVKRNSGENSPLSFGCQRRTLLDLLGSEGFEASGFVGQIAPLGAAIRTSPAIKHGFGIGELPVEWTAR